jgi:hypothetical protein
VATLIAPTLAAVSRAPLPVEGVELVDTDLKLGGTA